MRKNSLVILSLILAVTGFYLIRTEFKSSNQLSIFNNMLDGAQTCFLRVNQSYSARMIGLESSYLKKDFLNQTENCFNDLKEIAHSNQKITKVSELVEDISDQVYWFHRQQDFENPFTSNDEANEDPSYKEVVTSKFKKIESLSESLSVKIKKEREVFVSSRSRGLYIRVIFGLALVLSLILYMKFFGGEKKRENKIEDSLEPENYSRQVQKDDFIESELTINDNEKEEQLNIAKEAKPTKERNSHFSAEEDKIFDYEKEFRAIIKELTPIFFNLNSSLNFSGLENLKFQSKVEFSKKEIKDFLHLVARFTAGGKYPVQVEVCRCKVDNKANLRITAVNTNFCIYLDRDIKNSIGEMKEIVTHDHVTLGFELKRVFENRIKSNSSLSTIFVGQKKDLLKKITKESPRA